MQDLAIEAEGLVKSFGSTRALAGLDLAVPRGGILGLLGPNGAGKTTAVRVLATLARPDAGRARVLGADVVTEAGEVREHIGLTGQYAALDDHLTGRANLIMIGRLGRLSRRNAGQRADELLARFDLSGAAGRAVKTYSGGMRRRLDLAASLIGSPEVLFLDEPTTGLDPRSRAVMWEIIRQLAAAGTTLLLTTQYLDEADQLADRVAVIDTGRVVAEGTPGELKAQVGDDRIELALPAGSDLAAAAAGVKAFATGPVTTDAERLLVGAPVPARPGLTTEVVRALDAAGVEADSISLRRPSLDDVFLTLTGHGAADQGSTGQGGRGAPGQTEGEAA
ncbi:MAG: ATP-binding cassette domain-containing protein [Actinobacteria bacterium]|nr:ATP-binding cassette domain-containing protein [Actinomycetota bacterium]